MSTDSTTDRPAGVDEREAVEIEHRPPRISQWIAVAAVVFGAVATVPFATLAIPFGVAGVALVVVALFVRHSRSWLTVGTALILLGTIITGAYGAVPPELMLLGVGATIIGWDVGQHGIGIGRQLGRSTPSTRVQLVHTGTSAITIGLVSILSYAVFLLAGDGQHVTTVAVLLLGVIVVAWTFRS